MKKILLVLFCLIIGFDVSGAAPARGGRAKSASAGTQTTQSNSKAQPKTTGARAARQNTTVNSTKVVSRSASPVAPTTGSVSRGRSATNVTAPKTSSTKMARAAKQNVMSSGTKIATAAQNTVVDEECWNKFSGCMDSFCMMDNSNGGRCLCSNKNSELDAVLAEIQKLDEQSYQMATVGVEKIEMGEDADAVMAKTESIIKGLNGETNEKKSKRDLLDMSKWNAANIDFDDEEDLFSIEDKENKPKTGDALYVASSKLCSEQMPECSAHLSMMDLMYKQRVRSDCTAYENSLNKQRTESAQKLNQAQAAMREAALEQYRNQNKYDLGQCTIQFKQCMKTTAGCGDDFSSCVTSDYTTSKVNDKKTKSKKIKGATTTVEIAASTYDVLESKKPLCMNVTNQCVSVRDQVWDTFLREVAPELKSAELIAESSLRTSCISKISQCFQKACKDNIDPSDPEGSYDMCLTRPETLRSLCKVEIDPCEAVNPKIMEFVEARLASMRVDSCTKEFKQCLTSEDRCGEDYTQCIGLDTDTIVRLCPSDKLVGCQYEGNGKKVRDSNEIYDELSLVAEGIFLNIDNNMLTECQKVADAAMVKVCGSTEECNSMTVDDNIGARSLEYKICEYKGDANSMSISYNSCRTDVSQIQDEELGRVVGAKSGTLGPVKPFAGVIDGMVYWESIDYNNDGKLDIDSYWKKVDKDGKEEQGNIDKINSELAVLQKNINMTIDAIEADPKVQFCITGREVQTMRKSNSKGQGTGNLGKMGSADGSTARFPNLTKQMREIIALSALKIAKNNYYNKYDELDEKLHKDQVAIGERMAKIAGENIKDTRRWFAMDACKSMAQSSSLPKSPDPPKSAGGKIIAMVAIAACVVAAPFTGGATLALGMSAANLLMAGGIAVAGIGLLGNAGSGKANGDDVNNTPTGDSLIGSYSLNQWNYKETIVSTFEWETLNCHRCNRSQKCSKTKNPLFGNKYCKDWADPVETCKDIQF